MSKNSVNKATAKGLLFNTYTCNSFYSSIYSFVCFVIAALTQMLSAVNQRMETFEIKMKEDAVTNGNGSQSATSRLAFCEVYNKIPVNQMF